jgi:hypothetical protein
MNKKKKDNYEFSMSFRAAPITVVSSEIFKEGSILRKTFEHELNKYLELYPGAAKAKIIDEDKNAIDESLIGDFESAARTHWRSVILGVLGNNNLEIGDTDYKEQLKCIECIFDITRRPGFRGILIWTSTIPVTIEDKNRFYELRKFNKEVEILATKYCSVVYLDLCDYDNISQKYGLLWPGWVREGSFTELTDLGSKVLGFLLAQYVKATIVERFLEVPTETLSGLISSDPLETFLLEEDEIHLDWLYI